MSSKVTKKQAILLGALGAGLVVVAVVNFVDFSGSKPEAEALEAARSIADEMRAEVPPEQVNPEPAAQPSPAAPSKFGK